MSPSIKRITVSLAATSVLLCAAMVADAGGVVALTDRQLDNVTAAQGGPSATAAAGVAASGLTTLGNTDTVAVTGVGDSPFGGSNAAAVGVAFSVGRNGAIPAGSSTAVTTVTEAPGNFVVNIGWNQTIYGPGITFQAGASSSVGLLVPGMP